MDNRYFIPKAKLKIIKKIIDKLTYWNFAEHSPDFVTTKHNTSFVLEKSFLKGYQSACKNIGKDYRIPWRVHQAIWAAHHCLKIDGDFVELGTGKGFIMQSILNSIDNWNSLGKKLWLFDEFTKHSVSGKGKLIHDQYYAESIDEVKKNFSSFINVEFIVGDVLITIKKHPNKIAFLHLDLNDSDTEIKVLKKILNKMVKGGIILLDDYANKGFEKYYKVYNSFFNERGFKILTTPAGQGIILYH